MAQAGHASGGDAQLLRDLFDASCFGQRPEQARDVAAAGAVGNLASGALGHFNSPSAFIASCTAGRAATRAMKALTLARWPISTPTLPDQFATVNR